MPKRKLSAAEHLHKNVSLVRKLAVKSRFDNPNAFALALMNAHLYTPYDIMAVDGMRAVPITQINLNAFLGVAGVATQDNENRRRLSVFIALIAQLEQKELKAAVASSSDDEANDDDDETTVNNKVFRMHSKYYPNTEIPDDGRMEAKYVSRISVAMREGTVPRLPNIITLNTVGMIASYNDAESSDEERLGDFTISRKRAKPKVVRKRPLEMQEAFRILCNTIEACGAREISAGSRFGKNGYIKYQKSSVRLFVTAGALQRLVHKYADVAQHVPAWHMPLIVDRIVNKLFVRTGPGGCMGRQRPAGCDGNHMDDVIDALIDGGEWVVTAAETKSHDAVSDAEVAAKKKAAALLRTPKGKGGGKPSKGAQHVAEYAACYDMLYSGVCSRHKAGQPCPFSHNGAPPDVMTAQSLKKKAGFGGGRPPAVSPVPFNYTQPRAPFVPSVPQQMLMPPSWVPPVPPGPPPSGKGGGKPV